MISDDMDQDKLAAEWAAALEDQDGGNASQADIDALLGGAGLGDIGRHFPDTDPAYKGADSRVLLREAYARVKAAGWQVGNIDATIHAQAPKMAPHIGAMVQCITQDLGLEASQVNLKAKTNEGLGHLGRKEGIAANAVALLLPLDG